MTPSSPTTGRRTTARAILEGVNERRETEPNPERERDDIDEIDEVDEVEEIIEELAEHPDLPEADVVEQHQSIPVDDDDEYRDG
jgi:hypothetical protein